MSEIVDDLLSEVEQLENATEELQTATEVVKKQEHKLEKAQNAAASEVHFVALEAAKAAQDAATQSQKAAQTSIRQAESLKSEILELNESNFNWRQSVRNASKDFKSAKSSFSVMLITSIIFSLSALGTVGYLFYAMQKQQAQFKGEVLDIITTENTLLKKEITLKVDELASIIENMNYPVQNQAIMSKSNQSNLDMIQPIPELAQVNPIETNDSTKNSTANTTPEPQTPMVKETPEALKTDKTVEAPMLKPEKMPSEQQTDSKNSAPKAEPKSMQSTFSEQESKELVTSVKWIKDNLVEQTQLDKVKALITELQTQIKQLKMSAPKHANTTTKGLTAKQAKQLDGIGWLVRKQGKIIEKLEKDIKALPKTTSKMSYGTQLEAITKEQVKMREQLIQVEKSLDKLTELSKEPPPYSYKAK